LLPNEFKQRGLMYGTKERYTKGSVASGDENRMANSMVEELDG
jgi:hypothetical protein